MRAAGNGRDGLMPPPRKPVDNTVRGIIVQGNMTAQHDHGACVPVGHWSGGATILISISSEAGNAMQTVNPRANGKLDRSIRS